MRDKFVEQELVLDAIHWSVDGLSKSDCWVDEVCTI